MPNAKIYYHTLKDETRRQDKLDWLRHNPLSSIEFEQIIPDDKGNWLNQTDNDFETLLPLASKEVKANKQGPAFDKAVFKLFSTGVLSSRDEWAYDFNVENLQQKIAHFIHGYSIDVNQWINSNGSKNELESISKSSLIKWSDSIRNAVKLKKNITFEDDKIREVTYRPFLKKFCYVDDIICNTLSFQPIFFPDSELPNQVISITQIDQVPFTIFSSNKIIDHGIGSRLSQCLPLYRYDESGNRIENITDWGLEQFVTHYPTLKGIPPSGVRGLIFHYVYAVLHNPAYRKKYELNLKREFPRIPFYEDFGQWATWGKALMELHIDYENAPPFGLEVIHRTWAGGNAQSEQKSIFNEVKEVEPLYKTTLIPKTKLKADKASGTIELDEKTLLRGIPPEAWEYKLGNRSALEWVLDQYKESKPSDPTIAERFNTYRFADYKEQVIELLQKVCTVSVETMKIVREMERDNV